MKAHWPEFRTCCGLWSLKTGVFIIATWGMLITAGAVIANSFILAKILIQRQEIIENVIEYTDGRKNTTLDDSVNILIEWTKFGLGYYITWIIVEFIILLTSILLFIGAWKNKPMFLNVYLIINVPYWFVNALNILIVGHLVNFFYNFVLASILLMDLCRILVIRSAYREMTGKRRFLERNEERTQHISPAVSYHRFEDPPAYTATTRFDNPPHCTTCACTPLPLNNTLENGHIMETEFDLQTPVSENRQLVSDSTPKVESADTEGTQEEKQVNFKDTDVIYDQNQLEGNNSFISEIRHDQLEEIINENASKYNDVIRIDVDDAPTIFDRTQLNNSSSPIFEDLPSFSNTNVISDTKVDIVHPYNTVIRRNVESLHEDGVKIARPTTLTLNNEHTNNDRLVTESNQDQFNDDSPVNEEPAVLPVDCELKSKASTSSSD